MHWSNYVIAFCASTALANPILRRANIKSFSDDRESSQSGKLVFTLDSEELPSGIIFPEGTGNIFAKLGSYSDPMPAGFDGVFRNPEGKLRDTAHKEYKPEEYLKSMHLLELDPETKTMRRFEFPQEALDEVKEVRGEAGGITRGAGYRFSDDKPKGMSKRKVWGTDDRIQTCDTISTPGNEIGEVGTGDGWCTGTLIGPNTVLTAGHCVHPGDGKATNWIKPTGLILRRHNSCKGGEEVITFSNARIMTTSGWFNSGDTNFDYAVIQLNTKDTGRGWRSIGYTSDLDTDYTINVRGYPADKKLNTMWRSSSKLSEVNTDIIRYTADTFNKESGSGAYVFYNDGRRVIYGAHHGGSTDGSSSNQATRITKAKFNLICNFMDTAGAHVQGCP